MHRPRTRALSGEAMGVPGMRTGGTRRARDASGGSVRHARPRGGGQSRELCGASGRLGCRGPCGARSCRSQPGAPCASYPRGESPPPHSAQSSVSCEVCSPHAALHMVPPVVHGPELRYTAVVGTVPWHFAGAESSECARFVCGARFIGHCARGAAFSSHFSRIFRIAIGPSIGIRRAGARRLAKRAVTPLGGAAGAPERCRMLELKKDIINPFVPSRVHRVH